MREAAVQEEVGARGGREASFELQQRLRQQIAAEGALRREPGAEVVHLRRHERVALVQEAEAAGGLHVGGHVERPAAQPRRHEGEEGPVRVAQTLQQRRRAPRRRGNRLALDRATLPPEGSSQSGGGSARAQRDQDSLPGGIARIAVQERARIHGPAARADEGARRQNVGREKNDLPGRAGVSPGCQPRRDGEAPLKKGRAVADEEGRPGQQVLAVGCPEDLLERLLEAGVQAAERPACERGPLGVVIEPELQPVGAHPLGTRLLARLIRNQAREAVGDGGATRCLQLPHELLHGVGLVRLRQGLQEAPKGSRRWDPGSAWWRSAKSAIHPLRRAQAAGPAVPAAATSSLVMRSARSSASPVGSASAASITIRSAWSGAVRWASVRCVAARSRWVPRAAWTAA